VDDLVIEYLPSELVVSFNPCFTRVIIAFETELPDLLEILPRKLIVCALIVILNNTTRLHRRYLYIIAP
jgi:hypothetical protein